MRIDSIANFFRSLQPLQPAFAGAGAGESVRPRVASDPKRAGLLFASSSGDGGDYDDYEDGDYAEPAQETRRNPGASRGSGGGSGSGGGGRQRTIQFQPEERYWTEYLRIALPIIGLLLMIGLFWYWAAQLTEDKDPNDPVGTQLPPGTTEMFTPESTPVPTKPPAVQPTEAPATSPEAETEKTPEEEETTATEEPAADGEYAAGDSAVVIEGPVNLRSDASTEGEIVEALETGTVLTIEEGPETGGDYEWYFVTVEDTGAEGWIASEFIEPAGGE